MYEVLKDIDQVRLNFSDGGLLFMNITLAAIMFGVALEIKIENFKNILNILEAKKEPPYSIEGSSYNLFIYFESTIFERSATFSIVCLI